MYFNTGGGIYRGYFALAEAARNADLNAPQNVCSTKLRKYMACVTQVCKLLH